MLDRAGTLTCESLSKAHRGLRKQRARGVAIVIGIALSMQSTAVGQGSIDRYYDLHSLADYQLTDSQLDCHNEITFRESSNRIDARNGSHFGLGQMRSQWYRNLDPYRQIDQTIKYITIRYQLPCKAWAFHERKGYF